MPVQCPNCGSRYLRDSNRKESADKIRFWRFETALRCIDCKTRFVASTLDLSDILYAKCPGCNRLDLNQWSGKTYTPTGWTAFKLNFGANRYRCEYCRLNFAAFRKRKEIFTFKRWINRNVGDAVSAGRARMADLEFKAKIAKESMAGRSGANGQADPDNQDDNAMKEPI